jgi:nucleoside 2-deoxyribosyltransferase
MTDIVNHPPHYKSANGLEAIDVIEAFGLDKDFCLGNVLKYILRAGRKGTPEVDLQKALWYLSRRARAFAPLKPLYYLATPYSKYDRGIDLAFEHAAWLAAQLLKAGHRVYSPIAHTHPLAIYGKLDRLDHSIWLPFDQAMMDACDEMLVAHMPGWTKSKGVAHEIDYFIAAGKPVYHLDPHTLKMCRWCSEDAALLVLPADSAMTDDSARERSQSGESESSLAHDKKPSEHGGASA